MSTTEEPLIRTVQVGSKPRTIERPSGRKAAVAFVLLKGASQAFRAIVKAVGTFEREYGAENYEEYDRVQARQRFTAQPVFDEEGKLVLDADGRPVLETDSAIDRMTDAEWDAAGGVLRIPKRPTDREIIAAVFPTVLEEAEDEVYKLLALFITPNATLAEWRKTPEGIQDKLAEAAEELLDDSHVDELVELAVAGAEVVDTTFRRKAKQLGQDRMGKAFGLLGLTRTKQTADQEPPADASETETSSTSRPTPSSDPSETASPGHQESSSTTSPGTSSPPSTSEPTTSEPAPATPSSSTP